MLQYTRQNQGITGFRSRCAGGERPPQTPPFQSRVSGGRRERGEERRLVLDLKEDELLLKQRKKEKIESSWVADYKDSKR